MSTFKFIIDESQVGSTGTGSAATGTGYGVLDEANVTMAYSITVSGLDFGTKVPGYASRETATTDDDLTNAHIHIADRGSSGGVAFGFLNDDDLEATLNADGSWTLTGIWEANEGLSTYATGLASTAPGDDFGLYFNFHSSSFGGGEIRGQFVGSENAGTIVGTGLDGDRVAFQQGQGPVYIDEFGLGADGGGATSKRLTLTDTNSADFDTGMLKISIDNLYAPTEDVLSFNSTHVTLSGDDNLPDVGETVTVDGAVIGTIPVDGSGHDGNPLMVTFNSEATVERVQTLLRAVQYENTSATPDTTPRELDIEIYDGDGDNLTTQSSIVTIQTPSSGIFINSGQSLGTTSTKHPSLGDLDGDGDLDFVTSSTTGTVAWMNDGFGSFDTTAGSGSIDAHYARGSALGDLDGDGDLDLALGLLGGNRILMNDGTGIFTDSSQELGVGFSESVVLGDLDGDGDLDMVVANTINGTAYTGEDMIWLNDGNGVFSASTQTLDTAHTYDYAVADLNGDGHLDLVAAHRTTADKVWINDGTGSFTAGQSVGSASDTYDLSVADLDGDSNLDLVFANSGTSKIWTGNGDGTFTDSGQSLSSGVNFDSDIGDVDGDGDPDIMLAQLQAGLPSTLWLNDGTGTFTADTQSAFPASSGSGVAFGDLDSDGDLDLVATNFSEGPDEIWLNNGRKPALDIDDTPLSYTENDAATQIDAAATLIDPDGDADWTGGTLIIQITENSSTTDVISLGDNVVGTINTDGASLRDGTTQIGTLSVSGGNVSSIVGATVLTITFNNAATNALVQQVLQSVMYHSTSDSPSTLARTFSVTATDKNGETATDARTIEITAVNDLPVGNVTISGTAEEDQTLTAGISGITDGDGRTTGFDFTWMRDGEPIPFETRFEYVLTQEDVGAEISLMVSYTDGGGTVETLTSVATTPVVNVNDLPVDALSVGGTVEEDQTLEARHSGLSDEDGLGTISYQWMRDGQAVTDATAKTYVLSQDDVGHAMSVQLSYTDQQGTDETLTSEATTAVTNVNDDPTGQVSITGTASESETLTADTSGVEDEDGLGTFSYQWMRSGQPIANATSDTYELTQDDVGETITVQVSYTDQEGTAESLTSAATAAVTNVNESATGAVTITGTGEEDQLLTADVSAVEDADGLGTFSYQWMRSGQPVVNATSDTYMLTQDDVGETMTVQVRFTDQGGTEETLTSAATSTIVNVNDLPAGEVLITGTVAENETLTADASGVTDEDGLGTLSYQWMSSGTPIANATSDTYMLTQDDVGETITVQITYTDQEGADETVVSAATVAVANVNDLPTGAVTISGTAEEDQTLVADVSGIDDADGLGTFSYQWMRGGQPVANATGSSYVLTQADVNDAISVQVSYTDQQGTAESLTSDDTAPIANINNEPTGSLTISGIVAEGETLRAVSGDISDPDGASPGVYQWMRDGQPIANATGFAYEAYELTQDDVGAAISVSYSFEDLGGTDETVVSAATVAVVNVNQEPTGTVAVTGTAEIDETLMVDTSTVEDGDGLGTFNYQWMRGGQAVINATGVSYVLTQDDVGETISVQVSYTDLQGTAETLTSDPTDAVDGGNETPTGGLALYGFATQGSTLNAVSTIEDEDGLGTFTYQWLRDEVEVSSGTDAQYVLGADDVGAKIRAKVFYTDDGGTSEVVSSAASKSVSAVGNVIGSGASELLEGTPESDLLSGGPGNDTIEGLGANDILAGGTGNDVLFGDSFQVGGMSEASSQVYRLYQATLNRAPDTNGHEGWVRKIAEGSHTLDDVAAAFVGSQEFALTYGTLGNNAFINQLYLNVLGRDADAGGLAKWTGDLASGSTRQDVVLGLSESQEFRSSSAADAAAFTNARTDGGWVDDIYRLYQATLGRAPDVDGLLGWTEKLGDGQEFVSVVSGFVGSTEFQNVYGTTTNTEFVTLLYQNVLDRDPDTGGLATWTGRLDGATFTREEVVNGFSQSQEFINSSTADTKAWVLAQGTHDVLDGDGGDNVMMGGILSDEFVFQTGDNSTNTVLDLEVWDQLNFKGFNQAPADAKGFMSQVGSDVVFSDQGVEVTFLDTVLANITDDMFI